MAHAQVGDDQYGEDPSLNQLQDRIAELFGMDRALWVPSGTMANQIALRTLTNPGDQVIVARQSHIVHSEAGASGANSGVQFTEIGRNGTFSLDELYEHNVPSKQLSAPPSLIVIENSHNLGGGRIFPQPLANAVCRRAADFGLSTYLDGARLWNVSVATRVPLDELVAPFTLASVSFSKGLGAPAGSVLVGNDALIQSALRHRRILGGAMRQIGFLAAAAQYALDNHLDRLIEDHRKAKVLAERLARCEALTIDLDAIETNIVLLNLDKRLPDALELQTMLASLGLLVLAVGNEAIRLVTHLDVTEAECAHAADLTVRLLENLPLTGK